MKLGFLGTDYTRSALKAMELVYFTPEQTLALFEQIAGESPLDGLVILSTCNRVEFYFSAPSPHEGAAWLKKRIAQVQSIALDSVESILTERYETQVVEHLFRVVSGVESMVFGENEILTQVKNAHTLATAHKACSALLNKVFQVAITAGKRVRKETLIGRGSYSVSSIAIECIRMKHPDYLSKKVLMVGAGTMAMRAIKKLYSLGHRAMFIANRSEDKLGRLCEKYAMNQVPFFELDAFAHEFDILVVATSSDNYVIEYKHFVKPYNRARLVIDLSVPRNVSPDVDSIQGIELITVEGLKDIANKTIENRKKELSKITLILEDEIQNLAKWVDFKNTLCLPKSA